MTEENYYNDGWKAVSAITVTPDCLEFQSENYYACRDYLQEKIDRQSELIEDQSIEIENLQFHQNIYVNWFGDDVVFTSLPISTADNSYTIDDPVRELNNYVNISEESCKVMSDAIAKINELREDNESLKSQVDGLLDYLEADKGVISMATRLQRNKTIVSAIRNGETFRSIAQKVGVHHRTAQRVALESNVYSARSKEALPQDFTKKGYKVFLAQNPNREIFA